MMARLGDVVTIQASSKQLCGEHFWLLNLDMVEQQTGNVIDYNYVLAENLNGSIVQFDSNVVLYSKLRPNLNKVVLPQMDGYATSEMLPLTQKMKDLGLMDRTVADWKKIFKLKDLGDGYMITKYLDTAPDVIIPEHIGKKPVISIDRGVFSESNITSLESPVAPYLSDFFGWDVFPTLRIYGKDDSKKKYRVVPIESAKPDQFVSFGKYPQEWKDSVLRPIIWRVLERTENEMLLSSRFPSEYLPMHAKRKSVIWEKTDLRKWLNELFYDVAFSHNEKDRIVTVRNENPPNPQYSVGGGTTTEDKVFLLSLDELTAFGCVSKDTDITDHATASGTVGGGWLWSCWLRTNGKTANRFALRHLDNLDGEFCDKPNYVHPVIRIKL